MNKERRTKRPNSLMVMWRMMILYVLRDHIRKNEATNDDASQTVVTPVPNTSDGLNNLASRIARSDASNDITISMAKITRVFKYLLTYWLSFFMILPIKLIG